MEVMSLCRCLRALLVSGVVELQAQGPLPGGQAALPALSTLPHSVGRARGAVAPLLPGAQEAGRKTGLHGFPESAGFAGRTFDPQGGARLRTGVSSRFRFRASAAGGELYPED